MICPTKIEIISKKRGKTNSLNGRKKKKDDKMKKEAEKAIRM